MRLKAPAEQGKRGDEAMMGGGGAVTVSGTTAPTDAVGSGPVPRSVCGCIS